MTKILIIGVSGFIGETLYHHLSNTHDVYGISRRRAELPQCSSVDLLDYNKLTEYLTLHEFDVIINLASVMASSINLEDTQVLVNNISLTSNLIQALRLKNVGHLINASSSSVYSNKTGTYAETSPVRPSDNPDCLYGLSKFNSEMLFEFLLRQTPINLTNLRIPMVYGENMNKSRIHKVFEAELEQENKIELWGDGERVISHISIEKLCQSIEKIMLQSLTGTYNITDESISLKELGKRTLKAHGNKESRLTYKKQGSREKFILNGNKLKSLLDD